MTFIEYAHDFVLPCLYRLCDYCDLTAIFRVASVAPKPPCDYYSVWGLMREDFGTVNR